MFVISRLKVQILLIIFALSGAAFAQAPVVSSVSPAANAVDVSASIDISVTFDSDMDGTTITASSFIVYASSSGPHSGTISYDGPSKTASLDPDNDFVIGEQVTVILTTDIESSTNVPLDKSFIWSFVIEVDGGPSTFARDLTYATPSMPWSAYAADFDNDGYIDIATVSYNSSSVSVRLNNGDGTFDSRIDYATGDQPSGVFAADFDGDGYIDLAVSNSQTWNVSVLLNDGDGTFGSETRYTVGAGPLDVYGADFDGDGDVDLVSANGQADNVSVLLNNGDGTFASHVTYDADDGTVAVRAGDIDGDGMPDIAAVNEAAGNTSILINNGNGTFATAVNYGVGSSPVAVLLADMDEDGDLDMFVANYASDNVSTFKNNGSGSLGTAYNITVGAGPTAVCGGDVNDDGHPDMILSLYDADSVVVYENDGTSTFASAYRGGAGDRPTSVFAFEFDNDGDLDLAVTNEGSNNFSVMVNRDILNVVSTGPAANSAGFALDGNITAVFSDDLNTGFVSNDVMVALGSVTGTHAGTVSYDNPSRTLTFNPTDDFFPGEEVTVRISSILESAAGDALESNYLWSFIAATTGGPGVFYFDSSYATASGPHGMVAADLDQNGYPDIVTVNEGAANISVRLGA